MEEVGKRTPDPEALQMSTDRHYESCGFFDPLRLSAAD